MSKLEKYLADLEEHRAPDPTWDQARLIVEQHLVLPQTLLSILRSGWNETISLQEFVKITAFVGLNPACLLAAAELPTDGKPPTSENLEWAIQVIGLRNSALVLAVNATVRSILKPKPSQHWRGFLEDMMVDIEIGAKLGARAAELGATGGMLAGFAYNAGPGLLLAFDQKSFTEWRRREVAAGRVGRKFLIDLFGCEPYQVSALALQQLGFGIDIAFGVACGLGNLNPHHFELSREQEMWKAALQWISALKKGRGYPAEIKMRQFFREITPAKEANQRQPILETLYTEIARLRSQGSNLVWHLPRPSYERTEQVLKL